MTETARYEEAWRDRHRRMAAFKFMQYAGLPTILGAPFLHYLSPRHGLLALPAWFVSYVVAGVWLNRFRCPRCGKLFYFRWELKMRKNWRDCRHCGLGEGAVPIAD